MSACGVRAHVVLLGGSSRPRRAHRVVEHGDHVREGVAEEAGDAHRDVDAGPAELGQRIGSRSTTRRDASSHTADPEQRKHFGDVVAEVRIADVPHTDSPTDAASRRVLAVAGQQRSAIA
jgi:hypothetical protein